MKIKVRTDDGSMRQLNDWLAELREDGRTESAVPVEPQPDPGFRACHPVVRWDRDTAMTRTARIVAGRGELTALTVGHPGTGKRGH
jgi:hypothetical protein